MPQSEEQQVKITPHSPNTLVTSNILMNFICLFCNFNINNVISQILTFNFMWIYKLGYKI